MALRAGSGCAGFIRLLGLWLAITICLPLSAQGQPSGQLPEIYDGAGLEEHLGEVLPLDVTLQDETGQNVALAALIPDDRPVLLNFVYYDCPMLCSILLDGLTNALEQMEWTPGVEFEVITVSFAQGEGPEHAARQKEKFAQRLGREAALSGWHFMTGDSTNIHRLTTAAGFQFKWVEAQQEYVHPAAIMFVSPDGKITRYLHGLQFNPRDVRTALVEASEGRIGSPLDQVILYCFRYDPDAGSYVPYAANIMKLGGFLTVILLGGVLFIFWRRESRRLTDPQTAHAAVE